MKTLVLALAVLAVAVLAVAPEGLDWGEEVLDLLKGVFPLAAFLVGLVLLVVGIADIREKARGKKEGEREDP